MSFVNLRAKGVTVSVGGLDCTPLLISLDLRTNQALLDYSGQLTWSGTLELGGYPLASFPESLNPRVNPARWAPGVVVSASVIYPGETVPLPMRLRILRSPKPPYPGSPNLSIEVGDDFQLLNYRQPEGDESGVVLGEETDRTTVINSLLSAAGAGSLSTAIAEYPLVAPAQKLSTGSFIRQAGGFAAAVGRVMYQLADGTFQAPAISLTPSAFKVFTVGEDDAEFFSIDGEPPAAFFEVRGTAFTSEENIANPPDVVSEIRDPDAGNILVEDTRTRITGKGTNTFTIEERRREQTQLIFPELEGDTTMILAKIETKTFNYSTLEENQGRLLTEVITVEEPRGVTQPSEFPNDATTRDSKETTKTFLYGDDFEITEVRTVTREQNGVVNEVSSLSSNLVKTQLVNSERLFEFWIPTGGDEYTYVASGRSFGDNRPRRRTSRTEPGVKLPTTQYRDPPNYQNGEEVAGSVQFEPLAGDEFRDTPNPVLFPEGTLVSDAQCDEMALLYGALNQGARWGVRWAAELTSDWLSDFSPVMRIDFIQDGVRRAYLANGLSITLDQESASIAADGIELGTVDGSTITPPYTIV